MQDSGLKYSDDDSDARWLAKLLRLGLSYPRATSLLTAGEGLCRAFTGVS